MTESKAGVPLKGIRVLELGTMVAGPVAATLLADFGADVIKIEPPGAGDPIRRSGPFVGAESLYWQVEGRSKRSVTCDLRKPEGQQLLRDLAAHADILIENFRPGTMARWGLAYDMLQKINPRLIMVSISGFGQTGPYATRPAYDRIALAFAGLLHMTGFPDRPPLRPGTAIADYQSALFGAFAAILALYQRDFGGTGGQHVDVALYESVFRFTDTLITAYDKLGSMRERSGNAHYAASPGDHYPTSDGRFIALTVAADNVFKRLAEAIGRPELGDDPKFAVHRIRVKHYGEINGIVAEWIRDHSVADVTAALEKHGVPHSLIFTPKDIAADPHYAARGSIATVEHPTLGPIKMPGVFPRFSNFTPDPIRAAPGLGEHANEVLTDVLGYSQEKIDELRKSETI
jgi:crotonobetainyl-CoA:carnitine CoA-transferase CaiB-like acyl-CoA transferase